MKRLATPEGRTEYAKQITVAEGHFGNLKYNYRWSHLSHKELRKGKGECLLHVIGHNPGVICRKIPIERVENLSLIRGSPESVMDSVGGGLSVSISPKTIGADCGCFVKNELKTIGSGFAL